jgi:hypothetical protein
MFIKKSYCGHSMSLRTDNLYEHSGWQLMANQAFSDLQDLVNGLVTRDGVMEDLDYERWVDIQVEKESPGLVDVENIEVTALEREIETRTGRGEFKIPAEYVEKSGRRTTIPAIKDALDTVEAKLAEYEDANAHPSTFNFAEPVAEQGKATVPDRRRIEYTPFDMPTESSGWPSYEQVEIKLTLDELTQFETHFTAGVDALEAAFDQYKEDVVAYKELVADAVEVDLTTEEEIAFYQSVVDTARDLVSAVSVGRAEVNGENVNVKTLFKKSKQQKAPYTDQIKDLSRRLSGVVGKRKQEYERWQTANDKMRHDIGTYRTAFTEALGDLRIRVPKIQEAYEAFDREGSRHSWSKPAADLLDVVNTPARILDAIKEEEAAITKSYETARSSLHSLRGIIEGQAKLQGSTDYVLTQDNLDEVQNVIPDAQERLDGLSGPHENAESLRSLLTKVAGYETAAVEADEYIKKMELEVKSLKRASFITPHIRFPNINILNDTWNLQGVPQLVSDYRGVAQRVTLVTQEVQAAYDAVCNEIGEEAVRLTNPEIRIETYKEIGEIYSRVGNILEFAEKAAEYRAPRIRRQSSDQIVPEDTREALKEFEEVLKDADTRYKAATSGNLTELAQEFWDLVAAVTTELTIYGGPEKNKYFREKTATALKYMDDFTPSSEAEETPIDARVAPIFESLPPREEEVLDPSLVSTLKEYQGMTEMAGFELKKGEDQYTFDKTTSSERMLW